MLVYCSFNFINFDSIKFYIRYLVITSFHFFVELRQLWIANRFFLLFAIQIEVTLKHSTKMTIPNWLARYMLNSWLYALDTPKIWLKMISPTLNLNQCKWQNCNRVFFLFISKFDIFSFELLFLLLWFVNIIRFRDVRSFDHLCQNFWIYYSYWIFDFCLHVSYLKWYFWLCA